MTAHDIISNLLARFEAPTCSEQQEAVNDAKAYLELFNQDGTPRTDYAIKDSFQTGFWQKVKAHEMRDLEKQLFIEEARLNWLDENMSPEECMRLFGEEIMVGKLRATVDKMMKKAK